MHGYVTTYEHPAALNITALGMTADAEQAPSRSASSDARTAADEFTDGRRTRRIRNKVAVTDAYLDLVTEGNERPSVAEVAERSGISHRSVFRYFAAKDDLARSSIKRQIDRMRPMLQLHLGCDAPLDQRIDHLLIRRFELFEALAPVARLMRTMASEDPVIGEELTRNRGRAREQIKRLFAPELEMLAPDHAEEVLAVIDVLCSFESGELFVWDLNFTQTRSIEAIRRVLTTLLRN